jgi:hypothetical protein
MPCTVTQTPFLALNRFGEEYDLSALTPLQHERDVFASTAGQTSFTLTKTPVGGTGKVIVTRNGVDISSSFTVSGNVISYDSAQNYGCTFDLNDRVIVHYEAAV